MINIFVTLFLMVCATTANAALIYDVNRTIGAGTVTGFIETDGTLGVLSSGNITDWSVLLTAPNLLGGSHEIDFATDGSAIIIGTSLTATPTSLLFDFNIASPPSVALFSGDGAFEGFWCLEINHNCTGGGDGEHIGPEPSPARDVAQSVTHSGIIAIANASVVPVPAAVWLFGSGLIGLLGLAKHKKSS